LEEVGITIPLLMLVLEMVRRMRVSDLVSGRIAASWRTVLVIAVTMTLMLEIVRWLRVSSDIMTSW
jgi:hypothetical protein